MVMVVLLEIKRGESEGRIPLWTGYGGEDKEGSMDNCYVSSLSKQSYVIPFTVIWKIGTGEWKFKVKTNLLRETFLLRDYWLDT